MEVILALGGVVAILYLAMKGNGADTSGTAVMDLPPDVNQGADPGGTSGTDPSLADPNADLNLITGAGNSLNVQAYTTDDVIAKATPVIQSFEGLSLKAYPDPPGSGKFSIGWGHSIRPTDPYNSTSVITKDEADAILRIDIVTAYTCVTQNVTVDLSINQAVALTSFTFNEGCQSFKKSSMLKDINNGDFASAAAEFPNWIYAGGVVNQTLVSRRQQEQTIFEG